VSAKGPEAALNHAASGLGASLCFLDNDSALVFIRSSLPKAAEGTAAFVKTKK